MAEIHDTTMSLRFFGDDLDPDEITAVLAYSPTQSAKKGDVCTTKSGNERVARTGIWCLSVEDRQRGDLDIQIQELFELLSDDVVTWANLTGRFEASLFSGLFMATSNEGTSLSPETMRLLVSRNIPLSFDIYAPIAAD